MHFIASKATEMHLTLGVYQQFKTVHFINPLSTLNYFTINVKLCARLVSCTINVISRFWHYYFDKCIKTLMNTLQVKTPLPMLCKIWPANVLRYFGILCYRWIKIRSGFPTHRVYGKARFYLLFVNGADWEAQL